MTTDTSEKGLESLIVADLTGRSAASPTAAGAAGDAAQFVGPAGWIQGEPETYDRAYAVDLAQLSAFIRETQPDVVQALDLANDSPTRRKFLARVQGEVNKRGVIDILRHGLQHNQYQIDLFFGTPSPGNQMAEESFTANPESG